MKRFNWEEMKRHWQIHSSYFADIDYESDPDGLSNVCSFGEPLWVNRYYAYFQKLVYKKLFALLPSPMPGARALDVGCGAGRWSRFLADHGYQTIGIDIQPELIDVDRPRYPHIEFYCTSVQDYSSKELFDLVSSVTVIQHIPFEEQDVAIKKIRDLLKSNGHAIVLENILDQAPHTFSNTIREWKAIFKEAGFSCVVTQRYDYSPFTRFHSWARESLKSIFRECQLNETKLTPETFRTLYNAKDSRTGLKEFLHKLNKATKRLAVGLDTLVEPIFLYSNIHISTVHCAFLFKAI